MTTKLVELHGSLEEQLWSQKSLDSNTHFTRYVALNKLFYVSKPQFPFFKKALLRYNLHTNNSLTESTQFSVF